MNSKNKINWKDPVQVAEYQKQYYLKNKDRLREYRFKHPIKIKEYSHRYYVKNREKILQRVKKYHKKNRVKRHILYRKLYLRNRELYKKRAAKLRLLRKNDGKCYQCGAPLFNEMDDGFERCLNCRNHIHKPAGGHLLYATN